MARVGLVVNLLYMSVFASSVVPVGGRASKVCDCPPGMIGSPCKSLKDTTRYLPPEEALAPCAPGANDRVFRVIEHAMLDRPCDPRHLILHQLPSAGLGAILMYIAYGVAKALQMSSVFDVPDKSLLLWANKTCGNGSPRCYLKPFSACTAVANKSGLGIKAKPPEGKGARVSIHVPPDLSSAGAGSFFEYHSQILRYIWRLNDPRAAEVQTIKRQIGWPKPHSQDHTYERDEVTNATVTKNISQLIIALHVRHGDACSAKGRVKMYGCPKLEEYMRAAGELRALYGVRNIFLATDDSGVVKGINDKLLYPGWNVMSSPINRDWYQPQAWRSWQAKTSHKRKRRNSDPAFKAGFVEQRIKHGDGDPSKLGAEALLEIDLLSSCDMFVGTLSSTLGRAAFEIMAARVGYIPPYVSLDKHGWFYAQGGCSEPVRRGSKVKCPTAGWIKGKTHGGA